jgi:beta-mannosidase
MMVNLSKANWELASSSPGAVKDVAVLPTAGLTWAGVHNVSTAAAALAQLEVWSLDGAGQRFDSQDWWWRTAFPRPEGGGQAWLCFDGIATLAEVWLNGELILCSRNMFVQHEADVTRLLGPYNDLVICCRALDADLKLKRARPRWRAPMIEHQQLRWIRTTLLGRTPGWSPPVAAVGPWREVRLEHRSATRLQDVCYRSEIVVSDNGRICAMIHVSARVVGDADELLAAGPQFVVGRGDHLWTAALVRSMDVDHVHASLTIIDADLWWPHTHGEPALYQVYVEWPALGEVAIQRQAVRDIGLRTIALDTIKGRFQLNVNGVPVFCRGAVWTPLDIVTLGADDSQYESAISLARDAGMNMLRIAGTNVYELEGFYRACDAAGILVWQDLMFANMQYPDEDDAFVQEVSIELLQQLTRISQHACCAIWCGNSEVEQQAAMFGAERSLWKSALFNEAIPALIALHSTGIPYVASSACNVDEPSIANNGFPHQANLGCTSYYGIGAYLRPLPDAQLSQLSFASECLAFAHIPDERGLADMPGGLSLRTHHALWKQRTPRDLGAGWDFEDVRDHYLKLLFAVDPAQLRSFDHERYLAMSRVVTGEVLLAAYSQWRSAESVCSGALVLFFKDLWAGAGWGLVDASGQPKAAFHYARRAMATIAMFANDAGVNGVTGNFVNDSNVAVEGVCQIRLLRDGHIEVAKTEREVSVAAHSAKAVSLASWFDHFYDLAYSYRFGPMPYDVMHLRWTLSGQPKDAWFFPGGLHRTVQPDLGLRGRVIRSAANSAKLVISTDRFSQAVYANVSGYYCKDNYVHVAPGSEVEIDLMSSQGPSQDTQPTMPISGTLTAINCSLVSKIEWIIEDAT